MVLNKLLDGVTFDKKSTSSAAKLLMTMQTGGLTAGQNFSTGAAKGMKIVFEQLGYDTEGTDVMCPLHFGLLVSAFMTNMNKPLILKQARQQCQSS